MVQKTAKLLALLPALMLQTGPSGAQQILLDDIPPSQQQANDPAVAPAPEPAARASDRQFAMPPEPASAAPEAPREILLPLRPRSPQGGQTVGHRLEGEFPQESFWLFLPRAVDGATLDIATLSSINLLPGRSQATVEVNGTPIGKVDLTQFASAGTTPVAVPDGLLKAGRNRVDLRLEQVHRVMCGPEASFGLWTDVIAHKSGITLPASELGNDPLGFMAAASAQLAQGKTFHLSNANPARVINASPSTAQVERLFGGLPPRLTVGDYYTVADEQPQLARVTALPEELSVPDMPVFRRGGDGAIVLMTNSGEAQSIATLLSDALGDAHKEDPIPRLEPGKPRSLADLGIETIEGRGHYIRKSVSFRLDWDWLLLASQRAQMRLDYAYDRDLPQGALMLVKINDQTIRLLPLDEQGEAGQRLDPLLISFPANILQPGVNEISFEALVPGEPADAACIPRDAPAFRIFDTTNLDVPESPRMSLPRIDRTLASIDIAQVSLSEAAAQTLPLGVLAQIASIFADDDSSARGPDQPPRNGALRIGIPSDLARISGDIVSKNVSQLEEVLLSPPQTEGQGQDPWARITPEGWWTIFLDRERAAERLRELRGKISSMWRGPESDLDSWLLNRSAEAMLLQPRMDDPDTLWLVVRPNTDHDRLVASLVEMHNSSDGPKGQVSLFGYNGRWDVWSSGDRPLTLMEPLSPSNARAVVGNFVTLEPGRYIAPLFLLAILCAFSAIGLLIAGRRRQK